MLLGASPGAPEGMELRFSLRLPIDFGFSFGSLISDLKALQSPLGPGRRAIRGPHEKNERRKIPQWLLSHNRGSQEVSALRSTGGGQPLPGTPPPSLPPGPRETGMEQRPFRSSSPRIRMIPSELDFFGRIRTGAALGAALERLFPKRTGAPGWRAMPLPRTPLLVLGVALESFVLGASCGSPSNSLSYSYLHLPEPIQELPQFSIRSYLDDQPITRFDSLTGKMEPLVPWMEAVLTPEWVFRADLEKLSKLGHRAGGLHTWQVVLGCELMEDGSQGGFLHYGYDGMDFISFDKETLRWVAAQPQAQKLKEKWDDDPGWSQRNKVFLEETCIEWLQRYLSYRNKTLQRIEPPLGKVTRKEVDDRLEVLICQAFGFYPREIQATWTRDGEICEYETLPRNVAPNSDGTYYVWLSIEIDPKERERFRCRLEHQGLQEPLVLAWKEETAKVWWISMATVAASILGVGIFFLIYQWKRCRNDLLSGRDNLP